MEMLTSCPAGDGPWLTFYGGAYDAAFVAVHPFYTIPGHQSREYAPRTVHIKRSALGADLSGSQLVAAADQIAGAHCLGRLDPSLVDGLAKQSGCQVTWKQLGSQVGLDTLGAVNRALCTSIGSLRAEFADPDGARRLARYCDTHAVFIPSDGRFQPVMQRAIARLFRESGVNMVEAAAEFDETGRQLLPATLDADGPWDDETGVPKNTTRLFATDRSLLVTVEWDSFFTLICGRAERLAHVPVADLFDGFWCDASTSNSWWRGHML